jgi:hypothetical protein
MHVAHLFQGISASLRVLAGYRWRNVATTTTKVLALAKPFLPNFRFFFALALDSSIRQLAGNVLLG